MKQNISKAMGYVAQFSGPSILFPPFLVLRPASFSAKMADVNGLFSIITLA
jgi:hypothetical protein